MEEEEDTTIDIKGLDKVELLRQLWNAQKVASFFEDVPTHLAPKFNEELAKRMVKSTIDYFCGRCIKSDISGDVAESYHYDMDAGTGKFKEIVIRMRKFEMPKEYDGPNRVLSDEQLKDVEFGMQCFMCNFLKKEDEEKK